MVGKFHLLVVNKINDSLESELGRKQFTQARTPQAELVILSFDGSTIELHAGTKLIPQ